MLGARWRFHEGQQLPAPQRHPWGEGRTLLYLYLPGSKVGGQSRSSGRARGGLMPQSEGGPPGLRVKVCPRTVSWLESPCVSYAAGRVLVRWRLLSWVQSDSNKLPGECLCRPGRPGGRAQPGAPGPVLSEEGRPGPGTRLWLGVPEPSVSEPGSCRGLGKPGTLNSALFPGSDSAMKGQLTLLNPPSLQVQA